MVLKDADLPFGAEGSPHTQDASDREFDRRFKACSGITEQGSTADVFGDDFDMNGASVGSEAMFFRTAALAHADFSTINNPRAIPCATRILAELLKAELIKQGIKGVTLSGVSLVRVAAPHYGDESAGLRLTGTLSGSGRSFRFFQVVLVARKARAEVTGSFFNIGAAFPAALERSLFGKLGARLVRDGGV